jgi:hypothetical protein
VPPIVAGQAVETPVWERTRRTLRARENLAQVSKSQGPRSPRQQNSGPVWRPLRQRGSSSAVPRSQTVHSVLPSLTVIFDPTHPPLRLPEPSSVQRVECAFDGAEAHALLFQPDGVTENAFDQVGVGGGFVAGQQFQVSVHGFGFLGPVRLVGQQHRAIHQHGAGVGVPAAQLVEDGEAVGVDISPVGQVLVGEPGQLVQSRQGVATAEDDDGPSGGGNAR